MNPRVADAAVAGFVPLSSHVASDVVKTTVFLTDMQRDFAIYNAIWAEYFPNAATAPCRTTVGIMALPTPIAIELKCIAKMPFSDKND